MTDINQLSPLQRALFAIKKLKQELRDKGTSSQPVAIIGLSCRFPGAGDKHAFWQLLTEGKNIISHLPEQRRQLLQGTREYARYQPEHPYWGGYLNGIEQFDPLFFGITPREAILMDPQQRLLLEVASEALEDAGLPVETVAGSNTGVFIGMYGSEFASLQSIETDMDALYLPTGNASSIAANRISYQFDLRGPSMTLDTACSSSLVAVNLACTSLQNKQCQLAMVGGVKLNLLPSSNVILSQAKMLSPDGQCKTFDAAANGYVQGEGVGMVILKPLADALRDKDRIYCVIAGTAVNQDGKSNGLTAPNGAQQEKLLETACSLSRIDPAEIGYIECHGTGTVLGDPIEVEALEHVIGKAHSEEQPCWLGSVKTNIGHLEPAAGIAAIIKVALALQAAKIPPHQNFSEPNPHIPFDKYHFKIPLQCEDWPVYGDYRVASVSGFGFGGTNAHVLLRETPGVKAALAAASVMPEIFTLSAKSASALHTLVDRWCTFLQSNRSQDLSQLCHNLHIRRSHYFYRLAIIASSIDALYEALQKVRQEPDIGSSVILNAHQDNTDARILAQKYLDHVGIDWVAYESSRHYPHGDLPMHPWQHKVYWPEFTQTAKLAAYPLQGKQGEMPLQFEFILDVRHLPELADTYYVAHIGFYLEMLAFAARQISGQITFEIRDLILGMMIYVPKDKPLPVRVVFGKTSNNQFTFHIYSQDEKAGQIEHAHGKLLCAIEEKPESVLPGTLKKAMNLSGSGEDFFKRIKSMDMPIGGSIRWTERFWRNDNRILSEFRKADASTTADMFALKQHPGVFDACVQPLFILLDEQVKQPYLTTKITSFKFFGASSSSLFVFAERHSDAKTGRLLTGNWTLLDDKGLVIAACEGIQLTQLGRKHASSQDADLFTPSLETLQLSDVPKAEKETTVIHFLRDVVAFIFKMPGEDVAVDQPLVNMGMDSLMTMVLAKKIEEGIGVSISLQDLLRPVSIKDIATQVLELANPAATRSEVANNPWLPYRQPRNNPKIRLFCFPFGGGGASVYRGWQDDFPDTIEICPVQLPGRETLESTAPVSDLHALVAALYENICTEMDEPFAFYGHSFGSLIAFELARYLRKNHLREPAHLFVAAYPAPHLPSPSKFQSLVRHLQRLPYNLWEIAPDDLSDKQLSHIMKLLKLAMPDMDYSAYDAHVLRRLIPYFLADILIVATYQHSVDVPLEVPITLFNGRDDAFISKKSRDWGGYTQSAFDRFDVSGEHLFIKSEPGRNETIQAIITKLNTSGD